MIVNLLHNIQKIIADFLQRTYQAIKRKDVNQIIDSTLIISFFLIIVFVILYKIAINVEVTFFHTNYLVISNKIKNSLPQLYFFFLIVLAFFKWVINIRRSNIPNTNIAEEDNSKSFEITILKKTFHISKDKFFNLLLIGIILLFFVTKIPYWDLSFTVNHPLKYSTYTEPALNMFENKDPFMIQTGYMHNPITDSRGIGHMFGNLPILEWLLYIFYTIFNSILSLETITRLVMCIVGATALVSIFKFFRKAFDNKVAIIIVFLLSINQIFNLASFVTVYDTINIAITFLVFSLILNFNKDENYKHLFWAAIILGIGASIKENIFLWAYPSLLVIFIKEGRSLPKYLTSLFTMVIVSFLPVLLTNSSINYFPTKEPIYFIIFFLGILGIYLISRIFSLIQTPIQLVFEKTLRLMNRYKILFLIPIICAIGIIKLLYLSSISDEFLTDWRLLFNIDLYIEFVNNQAIPYCTTFITFLAVIAVFLLPIYEKRDKKNKIIIALFLGTLVYVILASKVLFFHSYYWLFIIISIMLLATKGLIILSKQFHGFYLGNLFLLVVILSITIPTLTGTRSKLSREISTIYKVVDYIKEQDLPEGTSFIDQGDLTYLTFKTSIYRVYDTNVFGNDLFKDYVSKNGFALAMEHFKIRYLITSGGKIPDYLVFANSFSKEPLVNSSYRRTDIIYSQLYPTKFTYYPDLEKRNYLLDANNLADQFYIVKEFNEYTIYGLTPACFETIIE